MNARNPKDTSTRLGMAVVYLVLALGALGWAYLAYLAITWLWWLGNLVSAPAAPFVAIGCLLWVKVASVALHPSRKVDLTRRYDRI